MLKDLEENRITLSTNPNSHLLILGRSGAGKTYFACRKVEEEIEKGNQIFIFDYSASYVLSELEKNRFQYADLVYILNPIKEDLCWDFSGRNTKNSLVDALLRGLKIQSYYQKRLLREAIENIFQRGNSFSVPLLMKQLENIYFIKEDSESQKNIVHLLNRLEPFGEIKELMISSETQEPQKENKRRLTIIQLSDYPEIQRRFLTEFLSELFWEEVRYGEKKADIVLFDEFQNMDVKRGSALSAMLREGRKFGLSVYLSTQFLGNYDKESVETLMQAGNILFFKPTEREMKFIAKLVDPNHYREWRSVLNGLKIGEAIIKGSYHLNNMTKIIENPILYKVEEAKTI